MVVVLTLIRCSVQVWSTTLLKLLGLTQNLNSFCRLDRLFFYIRCGQRQEFCAGRAYDTYLVSTCLCACYLRVRVFA